MRFPRCGEFGDGTEAADFSYALLLWSIEGGAYDARYDLNRDGVIDAGDQDGFGGGYVTAAAPLASGAISDHGPGGPGNIVGYAGYLYDEDLGLYLSRHRYYSPTRGRWVTRDPIGFADGYNMYLYCQGDPVARVDASGLGSTLIRAPELLRQGFTIEEIAALLGVSACAVTDHLRVHPLSEAEKIEALVERIRRNTKSSDPCERARQMLKQMERAIRSLEKQIRKHRDKIFDPFSHDIDQDINPRRLRHLQENYWPRKINKFEIEITTYENAIKRVKDEIKQFCPKWYKPWTW